MILVTGGTGFIGFHLCNRLGTTQRVDYTGFYTGLRPKGNHVAESFADMTQFSQYQKIYHLAAITDTQRTDSEVTLVNSVYSQRFLSILTGEERRSNERRSIVYASSASVYGQGLRRPIQETCPLDPTTRYSKSKAELDANRPKRLKKNITLAGLRLSNVYGANEDHKGRSRSYLTQMVKQREDRFILFSDGEQIRDWIHVSDVVEAFIKAQGHSGIFNVGTGVGTSFNDLAKMIDPGAPREYRKNPFAWYQDYNVLNINKARLELGWTPKITISEGLTLL